MRISIYTIIAIVFMQTVTSCMFIGKNMTKQSDILYPVTHIKEFDVKGIVFSDTTEFPFLSQMNPRNYNKRFSPTLNDIILFENVFHENYEEYTKRRSLYDPEIDNTGKSYQRWGRHYFGYIDDKGQKFLLVYLTKLESRREWRNWQRGPFVQLPGQWSIFLNLETKNLLGWDDVNK
jgi:hypothetical protein